MEKETHLKLFISYSHLDEEYINEFIKHLAPLKGKDLIKEWYDRKITAGDEFLDTIDNNLNNADIICLFISANFLDSNACKKEKKKAFELRNQKNIRVVPIILSHCGWLDDEDLNEKLAIPTDGKPISSFEDKSLAWYNIYTELKIILELENEIKRLRITEEFKQFLTSTDLLSKAHSEKAHVLLEDIFVYPQLWKIDEVIEFDKKESSNQILDNLFNNSKILIAGEDQAGKTTLCKKYFVDLLRKYFIPVYIQEKTTQFHESLNSKITKALKEQYDWEILDGADDYKKRIIPIIDDFHFVKNKEKYINELAEYKYQIIFVDKIFTLNFKEERTIAFSHFRIKEFSPLLRNELIEKWVNLSDKTNHKTNSNNHHYLSVDKTTELVNSTLGKILSSGIMPAYPFFILSIINFYDTFEKPLDQEITSQGYCYQALIYLYLKKQGVKNDEIDIYINFLSQVSFYLFKNKKIEIPEDEFSEFMKTYSETFNFPIKVDVLLENLNNSQIFILSSCHNFSFHYPYLYYYFVAKYLAEHIENEKDIIDNIINNLHKNEFAYIAIFISHHSKSIYILDEIILNAMTLFDKHKTATLKKDEISFFDKQIDVLIKEIMPAGSQKPEIGRKRKLETQESVEELNEESERLESKLEYDELATEIRRSVKTVEVMGRIIKNRSGSIEKDKLMIVFEEAMKVHLRLLTSFFDLIKDESEQSAVVKFISSRLDKIIEDKDRKLSEEELEKMSKMIFWNTNFEIVYTFVSKIIKSLGSDKLLNIIKEVCDKMDTPATTLVKHGILMWNNKNLQIDEVTEQLGKNDFSEIAKKIMRAIIVEHSSMHDIDYKDRQRIEAKIKIPSKRLLIESRKIDD